MNLEDILIPPKTISCKPWQLGSLIEHEIKENAVVLFFCSDYRGCNRDAEIFDFLGVREQLYRLTKLDFDFPICDLGDIIPGKTLQDTHYIIQELVSLCLYKNAIPVIIGGGNDFAYSLFSALNFHQKNIHYTQINNFIELKNDDEEISEKNFLSRILASKTLSLKNYHHLGYQKHLNETDSVKLMKEVEFDVIRLAEMMNSTEKTEVFFRRANLVTINCDAVESFSEPFSVHPQVNGLNRREICAYMKEIGLGENLKVAGIFNVELNEISILNHQLLAQMIWYFLEGVQIQKSHPKERQYETFWLIIEEEQYCFKRDIFSNLWYFGEDEKIENCIPCSRTEYEEAKKGELNQRLLR